MNLQRFLGLPNALKPVVILLIILTMILAGAAPLKDGASSLGGAWFFWLTMIVQLVFMVVVTGMFLYEIERLLTFGRDGAWPVAVAAWLPTAFSIRLL